MRVVTRDTDRTPASGPASGSRITYMVGGAAVDALQKLKRATEEVGSKSYRALKASGKPTRFLGEKEILETASLDPRTGQGPSFESNVHAIQMAEVEVNTESGEVKVLKMTTAVDAGPIINPQNLNSQLEGGMDMGVGFALREEHVAGKTKDWVTFKFPTMRTSFEMEVITGRRHGRVEPWVRPASERCRWSRRRPPLSTPFMTPAESGSTSYRPPRPRSRPRSPIAEIPMVVQDRTQLASALGRVPRILAGRESTSTGRASSGMRATGARRPRYSSPRRAGSRS